MHLLKGTNHQRMLQQHLEFPLHSPIFLIHRAEEKNVQEVRHEHRTPDSTDWHNSIQVSGDVLIYINQRSGLKVYRSNGNGRVSAELC